MDNREPKDVIEELFRRRLAGDHSVVDELVADDLVNHAAGGDDDLRGPQGREGWKQILAMIEMDLGEEITIDHHHLIAEGEFVVDHMTMRGRHQASTMPLLAGTEVTGVPVGWTYMHIWGWSTASSSSTGRAGTTSACSARSERGRPVARHSRLI